MIQSYGNPRKENKMGNKTPNKQNANPNPIKAKVANCYKVRFRTRPDATRNNVLKELDAGTEVEVLDASNPNWTRVKVDAKVGWIMSEYLESI